jgi:hypothetical protein
MPRNPGIDILHADLIAASTGHYPGVYVVNKFGRNNDIDGPLEDVWDGGGEWAAPTVARVHNIVSTHGDDDAVGGAGARIVRIYGLTDWDTAEVSEDINMDGVVPVATSNSYVIIHRMQVVSDGAGGSFENVGVITATAVTDATITAQINVGEGQTQMAIYGVPSTQKFILCAYYASMNKSGGATAGADIGLRWNGDPAVMADHGLRKHTIGVLSTGASHFAHRFTPPSTFTGPGFLHIDAITSTTDIDISAGFDGLLIDNT